MPSPADPVAELAARQSELGRPLRFDEYLDIALYGASGVLAVICLVMIGVFTVLQVGARLLGTIVPSADDFAGFCMAEIGRAHV